MLAQCIFFLGLFRPEHFVLKKLSQKLEKELIPLEIERAIVLLIVKSDWKVTNPPPSPNISPDTFNQNCEIAFLFNTVERSGIMSFVTTPSPSPSKLSGQGL